MHRSPSPLAAGLVCAATALGLAAILTAVVLAEGFPDDACAGHFAGEVQSKVTKLWPIGTHCRYYDPVSDGPVDVVVVPWDPMKWLIPALALSAPLFLLLGAGTAAWRVSRPPRTS